MKYALCIGINYVGSSCELKGCWNDCLRMKKHLKGFNVKCLMDKPGEEQPTRDNIIRELNIIIQKTKKNPKQSTVVIHYSGHGSYTRDRSGDERDGRDELICTSDNKGILDDDLVFFAKSLPQGVRCLCIFDCCHSGTMMDLQYRIKEKNSIQENPKGICQANVVCISGCMDKQTSADAWMGSKFMGAMTHSFFRCYRPGLSIRTLVDDMCKILRLGGFHQVPQITCSNPEVVDKRYFLDNLFN